MNNNKKIVGNIITNDGEILNYCIRNGEIQIRKRNNRDTIIDSINISNPILFHLQESAFIKNIEELIKSQKDKYAEVRSVPNKFLFNRQRTTDGLIIGSNIDHEKVIVLIKRDNPPLGFSLPGGMVGDEDSKETVIQNFVKEMKEEIDFKVKDISEVRNLGIFRRREIRGPMETTLFLFENHDIIFYDKNDKSALEKVDELEKESIKTLGFSAGSDASSLKIVTQEEYLELLDKNMIVPHHVEFINEYFLDPYPKKALNLSFQF